ERHTIRVFVAPIHQMLHRRLLEPVDLPEDVGERRRVRRAEVAAAGGVRDLAEQLFVDLHRHRLVAQAQRTLAGRDWRFALRADADGIDPDAESRGRLRRRARIDRTLVVFSIPGETPAPAPARPASRPAPAVRGPRSR